MDIVCLFLGIIFFVGGCLFFSGKGISKINLWKQIAEAEKEKLNIDLLAKNIGIILLIVALGFLLAGVNRAFRESIFIWYMICWMLLTCIDVYLIENSKRYLKK